MAMEPRRRHTNVLPVVVQPRHYRGFCFRGEGRRNLVVSAKHIDSDRRIVWRICKDKRARIVALRSNSEELVHYINTCVAPFFDPGFLTEPQLVRMHVDDLVQIAKVPLLQHNRKIDGFDELADPVHLPLSLLPLDFRSRAELGALFEDWRAENVLSQVRADPFVALMEMPDATRMPKRIFGGLVMYGPTITVEVKPKQGFFQRHPGVNLPYCNNCILQLEKCQSKSFRRMYDFCPLELYSGDFGRMFTAIASLFREPHRNLRVFCDGDCVYEDGCPIQHPRRLTPILFPDHHGEISMDTLYQVLCLALAGVNSTSEDFYIRETSILATLLKAQKLDSIGIVRAYEIFKKMPPDVQAELSSESNLLFKRDRKFWQGTDDRSLLERYFLAGTLKDCSLMVNLRLVRGPTAWADDSAASRLIRVQMDGQHALFFAVHVKVVDLDPKVPANLIGAHQRFMAGLEMVRANPSLRRPCRIP